MTAVSRAASSGFTRAVYGQAGRHRPESVAGPAAVSSWNASASISGAGCAGVNGGGVTAVGAVANMRSHDGYIGYDLYNAGATAFLDRWLSPELLVGGAFGVTHTRVDWDRYSARTSANNFSGGLYGSWRRDGFRLSGQAVLGLSAVKTRRALAGGGPSYSGEYDMWWGGAGLRASYDIAVADDTRLTPSLGVDYIHSRSDAFRERGSGYGLKVSSQHTDNVEGIADLELARRFCLGSMWLTPSARAGVAVQMADRRSSVSTRVASMPTMPSFRARSAELDRARLVFGVGADLAITDRASLEFSYDGSVQSHYNDHQFRLGLGVTF